MFQLNSVCSDMESVRQSFQDLGGVRLEQLIPAVKVTSACRAAKSRMERAGIWKEGAWQVDHLREALLNEGAKFGRQLKGCPEFDDLVNGEIPSLLCGGCCGTDFYASFYVNQRSGW